jgi:hypothetical protein
VEGGEDVQEDVLDRILDVGPVRESPVQEAVDA